jgi:heme exporter protein D
MNWSEFFNMGGYALYVWTSYGLMAIVLLLNVWLPFRRRAEVERRIRRLIAQTGKQA